MTRESVSSGKVGRRELDKSAGFPYTTTPLLEGVFSSSVVLRRRSNTVLGSPKEGRGPGWRAREPLPPPSGQERVKSAS